MRFTDEFYEKVNKAYNSAIKNEDFILNINANMSSLYDIVLRQYDEADDNFVLFKENEVYEKIDSNDTFNIIANKFKKIDINLYNSYLNILYDRELTKIISGSNSSMVYGEKLFLNMKNNTSDILEVTHEIMHRIFNQPLYTIESNKDINIILFGEVNSITFESVMNEELTIDKNKFLKQRFYSDLSKTIYYKFSIFLFNIIKRNGSINNEILAKEIENVEDEQLKMIFKNHCSKLCRILFQRLDKIEFDLLTFSKYILASVLSKTIYKRIDNKEISYEQYFKNMLELNTIETFNDGLDVLSLNYIKDRNVLKLLEENYDYFCTDLSNNRKR